MAHLASIAVQAVLDSGTQVDAVLTLGGYRVVTVLGSEREAADSLGALHEAMRRAGLFGDGE